ncbi:alpha/beta hydrolase [Echinicola sp. CAU 1574]|uniref:Alpha/beta hydrolase n=1 Tax=Echinicola arenosa TaxID=2774144 RepID=A0ABR9AP26_9BACT|nr:alpha/beta hydrolase [Echinicola arenosa]MBD8490541.1 alpha/beta hydrolase [Echinicola arenosa]
MKKKLINLFVLFFITWSTFGQGVDLEGSWKGELKVMAQKLPLVFNFHQENGDWKGTMDSPAQGAKGIPVSKVLFTTPMLAFEIDQLKISYQGVLVNDSIQGTFKQGGMEFPLNLSKRAEGESTLGARPQEPKPPFDYDIIETSFTNLKEGITLKGTITKPKGMGPFPAVVLVSGSGKQNRNGELLGHQPFWVIADYLSRNGIAVLRYDERGAGESEGDFNKATSFDFEKDAALALAHLKKYPFVDQVRSGVIGHSEGGMIVWIMAAEEKGMGFGISLAGPVVPIAEMMKQQTKDVLASSGASPEIMAEQSQLNSMIYEVFKETKDFDSLKPKLNSALKEYLESKSDIDSVNSEQLARLEQAYGKMISPWFFTFLKFDPSAYIKNSNVPVLALFGENDIQVNGPINKEALEDLQKNTKGIEVETKLYPGLNHLFQPSETGSVSEYARIEVTFDEEVLQDMVNWIKSL